MLFLPARKAGVSEYDRLHGIAGIFSVFTHIQRANKEMSGIVMSGSSIEQGKHFLNDVNKDEISSGKGAEQSKDGFF